MNYFENEKNVYFAKVKDNAIMFKKEKENAGYDIYACFDEDYIILKPLETKLIPTGIAWASSPEFYMQIEERSSTGTKAIKKSAGVVDSGYRGEIKIVIVNCSNRDLIFSNLNDEELKNKYKDLIKEDSLIYSTKKAIAQGIIHRVEEMNEKEISYDELLKIESNRGDKGWGSTNKVK